MFYNLALVHYDIRSHSKPFYVRICAEICTFSIFIYLYFQFTRLGWIWEIDARFSHYRTNTFSRWLSIENDFANGKGSTIHFQKWTTAKNRLERVREKCENGCRSFLFYCFIIFFFFHLEPKSSISPQTLFLCLHIAWFSCLQLKPILSLRLHSIWGVEWSTNIRTPSKYTNIIANYE